MDDSQGLKSPEKKVEDSPMFKSPLENDSDSDWKDLWPYENVAPAAADYEDIIYYSVSSSSDHEDGKEDLYYLFGSYLINQYDEFGNKINVGKILTDAMLEDEGVDEVLKKYVPAEDIPSEEIPVEKTSVEKMVSLKFMFDDENEDDKMPEKLENEMGSSMKCDCAYNYHRLVHLVLLCEFVFSVMRMLADLFTKALSEDMFKYLVKRLGMRCLTPEELEVLANAFA
ncbi:hypothetical protein Tco_0157662 [Tanacetum coccineum]